MRKAGAPSRKLTGLTLKSRRIPRQGMDVLVAGAVAGKVTSGTWSPTLEQSIAMAYLPAGTAPGTAVEIDVRGRREAAEVTKLPFYRRKKS